MSGDGPVSGSSPGFTLIEALMSLALFSLLLLGLMFLWSRQTESASEAVRAQRALDNIGIAMDGLIRNIEFSHSIELRADSGGVLLRLSLEGLNHNLAPHTYHFTFDPAAQPHEARHKSLMLGGQQYAYGIEAIRIVNVENRRFDITVTSDCETPRTISASVCVMHRNVTER